MSSLLLIKGLIRRVLKFCYLVVVGGLTEFLCALPSLYSHLFFFMASFASQSYLPAFSSTSLMHMWSLHFLCHYLFYTGNLLSNTMPPCKAIPSVIVSFQGVTDSQSFKNCPAAVVAT